MLTIFCWDYFFSGYLIPKGWKVLPLFRNIHHSPENFKEPEKFDPSRFEVIIAYFFSVFYYSNKFKVHTLIDSVNLFFQVAPKPNTFMPFGNGSHACPGNELAKLEILVFVHHLTTKYRFVLKLLTKIVFIIILRSNVSINIIIITHALFFNYICILLYYKTI